MAPALQAGLKKATAGLKAASAFAGGAAPKAKGDPNNIKVAVRCRPLNKTEHALNDAFVVQFNGNAPQLAITNPTPEASLASEHLFSYDYVYDPESTSEQVYEDMGAPLVDSLFDGFNGSVFAYGQTGSGKTHSMMGSADDPDLVPRVCKAIFERIDAMAEAEGTSVQVHASYLQIYREVLQDLLSKSDDDLKIRRDPRMGTYVQGLSEHELTSAARLQALIDQGNKKRAVASTLMNSESSRSHAVVIIRVVQDTKGSVGVAKRQTTSKINLVDLAGSERAAKTGASGDTLKEGIAINQSLSALGNVINALTDSTKAGGHIPYRSSKLTHLLEECLGGNSITAMLAAISPAARNYAETVNTLQYAQRAKLIVIRLAPG